MRKPQPRPRHTKQVVIVKSAILQQDHRATLGHNSSRFFQNTLVFLKGNGRALLLQDDPTQRQRSTTIDQLHPHNYKLIPQTAAVQGQINLFSTPICKGRLHQTPVDSRWDDLGIFQPAYKLPLLARRLCFPRTMYPPLAQVDTFLHEYAHYRPGKCDQATHVMKTNLAVSNHLDYGTIKSEAVRHRSSPGLFWCGNLTLPRIDPVGKPHLLILSVNQPHDPETCFHIYFQILVGLPEIAFSRFSAAAGKLRCPWGCKVLMPYSL